MSVGSGRVKAGPADYPSRSLSGPRERAQRVRPELRTSPAGCDVVAAPTWQGSHHGVAARFPDECGHTSAVRAYSVGRRGSRACEPDVDPLPTEP